MKHKHLIFKEYGQEIPSNAVYLKVTGAIRFAPWDKSGNLREGWKRDVTEVVEYCKANDLFFLPIFWSALWFREHASGERPTGLINTYWNIDGDIDKSREYFYTDDDAIELQCKAILWVVEECERQETKYAISMGWESHTQEDRYVIPWFRCIKKEIDFNFKNVSVGLNSYKKNQILKGGAAFMVTEGGSHAAARARKNGMGDRKFKHYIVNSNPGRLWPPHNPAKYLNGKYTMEEIYKDFAEWGIKNIEQCGCTGAPFPRWYIEKVMLKDIEGEGVDISEYDFSVMKEWFHHLYELLVEYSKKGLNDKAIAIIKSPPAMIIEPEENADPVDPPEEEENKKTAPISVVEPEEKEVKMNPIGEILNAIGRWFREEMWWLIAILAAFVFGILL